MKCRDGFRSVRPSSDSSLPLSSHLLRTEPFVMRQSSRLDQILQVRPITPQTTPFSNPIHRPPSHPQLPHSPRQKVPQIDKLAVPLILDINHPPTSLSTSDLFPVDHDVTFGADYRKGDHGLSRASMIRNEHSHRQLRNGNYPRVRQLTLIRSLRAISSSSCSSVSIGYNRML